MSPSAGSRTRFGPLGAGVGATSRRTTRPSPCQRLEIQSLSGGGSRPSILNEPETPVGDEGSSDESEHYSEDEYKEELVDKWYVAVANDTVWCVHNMAGGTHQQVSKVCYNSTAVVRLAQVVSNGPAVTRES